MEYGIRNTAVLSCLYTAQQQLAIAVQKGKGKERENCARRARGKPIIIDRSRYLKIFTAMAMAIPMQGMVVLVWCVCGIKVKHELS